MACVSLGLAFLPWIGRAVLGFTSIACIASVYLLFLILRALRTPLTKRIWVVTGIVLGLTFVVFNILLHLTNVHVRVAFLFFPTMSIMLWGIYEGVMLGRIRPSVQHKFLVSTQLIFFVVIFVWQLAIVLVEAPIRMTETGESVNVAVGRLIVVSLILVLMVSMVGMAMEKMRSDKEKLLAEKSLTEAMNKKMAWTLQERNQTLKALMFSSKARNAHALVSNLAHEMNQPLGCIRLYADHLLFLPEMSRLDQEDVLRKVMDATERAQQSLQDFRMFFSTSQNDNQIVHLDALMLEILALFSIQLGESGIVVTREIETELTVAADVTQLKMVILNLLTNAMDALRTSDEPRCIHIRLWREHDSVCCSMHDSGPGLPSELHDKLFSSYFTTKEFGVGLGLWLCRAIVEYYGGAISAFLDGPGTSFRFNLPFAEEKK